MSCPKKIALKHAAAVPLLKKKSFERMTEGYPIHPKPDCNKCVACLQKRNIEEYTATPLLACKEHSVIKSPKCHDKVLLVLFVFLIILALALGILLILEEDESHIIEEFDYLSRNEWGSNTTAFRKLPRLRRPVPKVFLVEMNTECDNNICTGFKEFEENGKKKIKLDEGIMYNFYQDQSGKIFEGRGWNYQSVCQESNNCKGTVTIALLDGVSSPPSPLRITKLKAFLNFSISSGDLKMCFQVIVKHTNNRYYDDIAIALDEMVKKDGECKYNK
ncbi:uncharacterized protein LOC115887516 [Sitophilus oryzae]|uniref:Uncharacterized protein LOC115887516 n=1 Tax=Sitophilus oryzae TaxID=7048 RepID=A0A6J2YHU3_SITOR|nr:uncharacterized protein LOC115887516 [Sitophilus oryzae]